MNSLDKKHQTHGFYTFCLDKETIDEDGTVVWHLESEPRRLAKELKSFLEKDLANPKNCINCGELTPELAFRYKEKVYHITCTQIKQKNKVLAQTDYKKFSEYCTNKNTEEVTKIHS